MYNKVKTSKEIIAIRESGRMLATVLQKVEAMIDVGVTGKQIDAMTQKELAAMGGVPAFLGYQGFPNAICISINDAGGEEKIQISDKDKKNTFIMRSTKVYI